MELIINNITYTLKSINSERRIIFVNKILSFYNYKSNNFESFLKETQEILKNKYKLDMTLPKVKSNFFKHYSESIYYCIWNFLSSEDKKELKNINNLDISQNEIKKFIEYVCNKIKEYDSYVKKNHKKTSSEDIYSVYSYLSRIYGWTFDEIKEMDELELMKSIENAVDILEKENASNINSHALAAAYGSGNKKAKSQIDSINKKVSIKNKIKNANNIEPKDNTTLSRNDIEKIMEIKNG